MKTINLIVLFMIFTLNALSQTSEKYYEKGETETYGIRSDKGSNFICRVDVPFDDRAPLREVPIVKYRLWPKETLVDSKEYIKKYLLPYIEGELTPDNSDVYISFYYALSTGKMEWITVYHESSFSIPIKAIERFEKVMSAEDKVIFNRSTEGIDDIDFYQHFKKYNLYEMKHQSQSLTE